MDFPSAAATLGLTLDELSQLSINPQFPPSSGSPTPIITDGSVSGWDWTSVTFDDDAIAAFGATMAAVASNGWVVLYEGLCRVDWATLAATALPIAGRPFFDPGPFVQMSIPLDKIAAPAMVSGRVQNFRQRIREGGELPPLHLWRAAGGVDSWTIIQGGDLYAAATLEGLSSLQAVIASDHETNVEATVDIVP